MVTKEITKITKVVTKEITKITEVVTKEITKVVTKMITKEITIKLVTNRRSMTYPCRTPYLSLFPLRVL